MPLSDQGADLVMVEIEYLLLCATGQDPYVGSTQAAVANAMLNHLTELHRLRNDAIAYWLEEEAIANKDYQLDRRLEELHYA